MTAPNPWGIVVTRTLHLSHPGLEPACRDYRVERAMADLRRRYRAGERDAPMIYGYADGRPVCRRCIATIEGRIAYQQERLDEVRSYEESR